MSEMDQMCRTCLSSVKELLSIYTLISSGDREDQNGTRIVDCFTECFKIEMTEDDKLPQKICLSCLDNILEVRKFYHRCINSENYLKQQIDFNQTIKIEPITGFVSKIEVESASNAAVLDENIEYEVLEVSNEIVTTSEIVKDVSQFRCVECDENFKYEKNFKLHMKLEHVSLNEPDVKQFIDNNVCDETGPQNEFEDVKTLKKANIIDKPYKCDKCDCSFRYKLNFVHHTNRHKQNNDPPKNAEYTCSHSECKRNFYSSYALQKHSKTHLKDNSLLCAHCGFQAKSKRGLFKLVSEHDPNCPGIRKYKCRFCDKGFSILNHLQSHERVHTGERPHVCKYCGKSFSQSSTLNTHLTLHIGKPISCPVCDKKFSRNAFLKVHYRVHSQERPYACGLCPQRYTQKCHLQSHMAGHSDERKFICDICNKAFLKKEILHHHRKKHAPVKQFKCPYCSLETSSAFWFRKHLIRLHNATANIDLKKYQRNIDYKNLKLISLSKNEIKIEEKEKKNCFGSDRY